MDRRRFLSAVGVAWGGGPLVGWPRRAFARRRAGAATPPLERLGLQLYTVRSLMESDAARTLDAAAAIGYREVEFAGHFGHPPATLRRWLDDAGLTAPAAHVGLEALRGAGLEASIEAAATLGHRWLALPWIPEDLRSPDGYRSVARTLNEAGARAAESGLRVAYHNHEFEFDALPPAAGARPETGYSILLDRCEAALVDMEIDFYWAHVAGVDVLELFAARAGRFRLCHVKDRSADGRMVAVGDGEIDWAALFERSAQAGLDHYIVEHDRPADPLDSARRSYAFLSRLGSTEGPGERDETGARREKST